MSARECRICGESPAMSGRRICHQCRLTQKREYSAANKQKIAQAHRAYRAKHAAEISVQQSRRYLDKRSERLAYARAWRAALGDKASERDRNRYRAERLRALCRATLRDAVRSGRIHRGPCEVCGSQTTQAHHDDYDQPLVVRWLCQTHHAKLHSIYQTHIVQKVGE